MLPGKTYTPEDILRLALRRVWLIVLPLLLGVGVAVTVSRLLPEKYRSETLIMLVPQRIPESYVKSTVTASMEDRLATLSAQILSRSRLERIILWQLREAQKERASVPTAMLYGRVVEHIDVSVEESYRSTLESTLVQLSTLQPPMAYRRPLESVAEACWSRATFMLAACLQESVVEW